MAARLKTLVVDNFRSLKGQVVVPLDAQVVLIHGTNGMGKTSVLAALELALTGKVDHLSKDGEAYRSYLTNLGAEKGSARITTTEPLTLGGRIDGQVAFSDDSFDPTPLLDANAARFFADRCFLPQATLGRLLELYNDQKTGTTSPLTQFVKDILGLDPLDALVDGLPAAFHVTRIRNRVPEYRRLETLQQSVTEELQRGAQSIRTAQDKTAENLRLATELIASLGYDPEPPLMTVEQVGAVLENVRSSQSESEALGALERTRSEMKSAASSWQSLPANAALRDQAARDQAGQAAADALAGWRAGPGTAIQAILDEMLPLFPDLPALDDGPESTLAVAQARARAEVERCKTILAKSAAANAKTAEIQQTIQRSTARIGELELELSASAENTHNLASALASIAPHVAGDLCPVCDRDFADENKGSLSAHIADKIAALTSEAGRLQSLASERAALSSRLSTLQRDASMIGRDEITAEDQAELTVRSSQMTGFAQLLEGLTPDAINGAALMSQAATAREAASAARRISDLSSSVLPDIERLVLDALGQPLPTFPSVEAALAQAAIDVDQRISLAERRLSTRIEAISALEQYKASLETVARLQDSDGQLRQQAEVISAAVQATADSREAAKAVSDTAERVRSAIVKKVFNTSLNKVWRDLFVRLAPSEDFVPMFKLPEGERGKVEAVLETVHRSGKSSGSPGAMLSQGNLNTSALTLFLALHLSVPAQMPWLVLDDPVQSMDDVHIAQFAALLRTLSKSMGRQVIVAVHERALFDYLTLELSPAFAGDSLITVEISRNFEGNTVAKPNSYVFEEDNVIAA